MDGPGMAYSGQPLAQAAASVDPKTELNQFCQRFCRRPVNKTDIVYVTSKFGPQFGDQFQAIVRLNCLQGQEYAGNLCQNAKEAEKSAAQQALEACLTQLAVPPQPDAAEGGAPPEDGENPAITPKTKLNSLCMRIAKRYLQKGETAYECRRVPGGYQATVKLTALPGEWKDRLWAGQVFSTKQKAEQSAAEIALMQISQDAELNEEAEKPKGNGKGTERPTGTGKGKGRGKDKGSASSWTNTWPDRWGKGWGGWSWGGWGNWSWQSEPSGPNLPRERVTKEQQILGEVLEWRETYGWIKPSTPLEHSAVQERDGKIYCHQQDLLNDVKTLSRGQCVKFHVYEDPSGLGAEEVELQ